MKRMSEQEETDLLQIVKDIRVESNDWRKDNDEVNERFRNDLMQEVGALISELKGIKLIVNENTIDIKEFKDIKLQVNGAWGAAKFLATISSWFAGIGAVLWAAWLLFKDHFKHL